MNEGALGDELLIQRAQNGDRTAFDDLVRRHEVRAFQYAYRLTRNQEEASDVVSEAFVRVFNAIHNFKGKSSFSTWLYRILTNCYLDMRKRERNRPTTSLDTSPEDGEIERQYESPDRSPHEESERSERERAMVRAVGKLPEYQQAMITMYHVEMMSYEDIAAALDLPIGTVKSRLNRARLMLRDFLAKDEELFRT